MQLIYNTMTVYKLAMQSLSCAYILLTCAAKSGFLVFRSCIDKVD